MIYFIWRLTISNVAHHLPQDTRHNPSATPDPPAARPPPPTTTTTTIPWTYRTHCTTLTDCCEGPATPWWRRLPPAAAAQWPPFALRRH